MWVDNTAIGWTGSLKFSCEYSYCVKCWEVLGQLLSSWSLCILFAVMQSGEEETAAVFEARMTGKRKVL
jgi:hypothetical protein